jgi:hypothetical protein
MKIEIKDSGKAPDIDSDAEWIVTIDGKRRTVAVWLGSGFYGARVLGYSGAVNAERERLREAIAIAVSPEVQYVDGRDDAASIRKAVAGLSRCLEIRAAMRGVKLPKLRGAK